MLRIRTLALGAAMIVSLGSVAAAQGQPSQPGQRPARGAMRQGDQGMHMGLLRGIDLTDAQKAQLETLREQQRTEMQALRAKWDGRPDSTQRGELRALTLRHRQQVRAVLTPAQQATFDANVAQARDRMEDRRDLREDRRDRREDRREARRDSTRKP